MTSQIPFVWIRTDISIKIPYGVGSWKFTSEWLMKLRSLGRHCPTNLALHKHYSSLNWRHLNQSTFPYHTWAVSPTLGDPWQRNSTKYISIPFEPETLGRKWRTETASRVSPILRCWRSKPVIKGSAMSSSLQHNVELLLFWRGWMTINPQTSSERREGLHVRESRQFGVV